MYLRGTRLGAPFSRLAAAAVVVAATAVVAAKGVATAVAQQEDQDDDPAHITTAKTVIHKITSKIYWRLSRSFHSTPEHILWCEKSARILPCAFLIECGRFRGQYIYM